MEDEANRTKGMDIIMTKSRILWGLWILVAVVFWFFANTYSGVLLMVVSILVPLVLALVTKIAVRNLRASIQAETAGAKNSQIKGAVSLENTGFFSVDRVVCQIKCENLMTGEVFNQSLRMAAPAKLKVMSAFVFSSKHCGRIRLSVAKLTVYDSFGIFKFRIHGDEMKIEHGDAVHETKALVRPETFPTEVQIAYGESMSLDSDEYSMLKAGFDPSETFAIREYMPGDRIKQIHWKLSEKMNNLMVRDYGLPIQNTILLLLETGKMQDENAFDAYARAKDKSVQADLNEGHSLNPDCMDAIAEGIISLSQELIEQQIVHSLGWYNHEESSFYCTEISCQEELAVIIPEVLGTAPKEDTMSVLGHYLEEHEQCEFAHVVLFTSYHVEDIVAIEDQCLVTEVLCEADGGGGFGNDFRRVVSVSPQTIAEDMGYLEI